MRQPHVCFFSSTLVSEQLLGDKYQEINTADGELVPFQIFVLGCRINWSNSHIYNIKDKKKMQERRHPVRLQNESPIWTVVWKHLQAWEL